VRFVQANQCPKALAAMAWSKAVFSPTKPAMMATPLVATAALQTVRRSSLATLALHQANRVSVHAEMVLKLLMKPAMTGIPKVATDALQTVRRLK